MQQKQIAIAQSIIDTAAVIAKLSKQIPIRNRYWFKKTYSRGQSRKDKAKRKLALINIMFSSVMGASQLAQIIATPIPKFKPGSNATGTSTR
jgi:hypothetical protein